MKDVQSLVDYLRDGLSDGQVHQATIILHLLENGGRATKTDLIRRLMTGNDPVSFYYESVLARATVLDLESFDMFTYDPKTENYFLNVSIKDVYLKQTAIKLARAKIEAWHESQQALTPEEESHEKLVRDNIPAIIQADGRTPVTEQLSGDVLREKLLEKLAEEHLELLADLNLDEISDMIEVLFGLARTLDQDEDTVLAHLRQRRAERGGFTDGTYLKRITREVPRVEDA
jgi:predicted house-cleaning noncanonical NTP pyrophosphatase (MazG superfamily)